MAALWTLGDVGIYVDGFSRRQNNIWAEIQVIEDDETILHWFGAESERVRIRGHLWGTSNVDTLTGYARASTSKTLTGPNTYSQTFKIMSVNAERRPDKTNVTSEFWEMEIEMTVTS